MGFINGKVVGIEVKEEGKKDQFICLGCLKPGEKVTDENAITEEGLTDNELTAICDRCGEMFPEEQG